jgi:hypothetical protein
MTHGSAGMAMRIGPHKSILPSLFPLAHRRGVLFMEIVASWISILFGVLPPSWSDAAQPDYGVKQKAW